MRGAACNRLYGNNKNKRASKRKVRIGTRARGPKTGFRHRSPSTALSALHLRPSQRAAIIISFNLENARSANLGSHAITSRCGCPQHNLYYDVASIHEGIFDIQNATIIRRAHQPRAVADGATDYIMVVASFIRVWRAIGHRFARSSLAAAAAAWAFAQFVHRADASCIRKYPSMWPVAANKLRQVHS